MVPLREIGRAVFKFVPGERYAFFLYEGLLNRYVARSLWPAGFYTVEYPADGIEHINIYETMNGPGGRRKLNGEYEPKVAAELASAADSSDVWIIGGGFGYHATATCQVAQSVTIFEADSKRVSIIRDVLARNGVDNATVVEGIVGDSISLNNFSPPDVALMDIEGWELDALKAGEQTVSQVPHWIIEIHESGIAGVERAVDGDRVKRFLESKGFVASELSIRKVGNYHIQAMNQS